MQLTDMGYNDHIAGSCSPSVESDTDSYSVSLLQYELFDEGSKRDGQCPSACMCSFFSNAWRDSWSVRRMIVISAADI